MDLTASIEIDGATYHVASFSWEDALDTLPELRAEILEETGPPSPRPLVGEKALLTLTSASGDERATFVGVVSEASLVTEAQGERHGTQLVVHPRLVRLKHRTSCRVFRDKSVPDIVKEVLTEAGLDDAAQDWRLGGDFGPRVHVAQYRETDFDFVRRLLAEVGIAFYVDMAGDEDKVVFFDGSPSPIEGEAELSYARHDKATSTAEAVVTALQHVTDLAPGKTYLREYDFERPRLELNAEAEEGNDREKQLEVYDYPGRYAEEAEGDLHARVLLEALRARRERLDGEAHTLRLRVGHTFSLVDHPYGPLNREYLVASVKLERGPVAGRDGDAFVLDFRALPVSNPYRPEAIPRARSVPGAQLALTTGPAGAEIHPDEHGRVKALFPWDRNGKADENCSKWIRTCQIPLGGSMLTPRVGWEVVTNFEEGDVDRPLVFGRMYNADKPPPYKLPDHKARMSIQTATTPGGGSTNELRMDDTAGNEEMFMNASKNASVSAGNNATESVGANETRTIGGNQDLNVTDSVESKVDGSQSWSIGGNQGIHTSTFMVDDVKGGHSLNVGGSKDIKAGGGPNPPITAASTLDIGSMQIDLAAGSIDEATLSTMSDSIGAVLLELTAGDRTVTAKGARTEDAGAAKVILSSGGRAVDISGAFDQKVAGAIGVKSGGGREDSSGGDYLDVAAGAQLIKATNVVFEASSLLSVVMGGSTITLTPASVSIAGGKITIDGTCSQLAGIIGDN